MSSREPSAEPQPALLASVLPPPADPATVVESFEEAKSVATALAGQWRPDSITTQTLQRPWPTVDLSLSRGIFAPLSTLPPIQPAPATTAIPLPDLPAIDDDERGERAPPPAAAATEMLATVQQPGVLSDGSLPLPSFPNEVTPERVQEILDNFFDYNNRSCGLCRPCLLKKAHIRAPACPVVKGIATWRDQLGGVTYDIARKLGKALAANKQKSGVNLRCDKCKTCLSRVKKRPACLTVSMILEGSLPERLRGAVAQGQAAAAEAEAAGRERHAPEAVAPAAKRQKTVTKRQKEQLQPTYPITLNEYLHQQYGGIGRMANSAPEAAEIGDETEDDDEEEDLRWAAWAPYIAPYRADYQGEQLQAKQRLPHKNSQYHDSKHGALELAQRLGVDVSELQDWMCNARVAVEGEPKGAEASSKKEASTSSSTRIQYDTCGHFNAYKHFACERCGTARWDGPVGQLRSRVAAALQSGALVGALGATAADVDAAVPVAVAARIATEAGTFTEPFPVKEFQENRGVVDKNDKRGEEDEDGRAGFYDAEFVDMVDSEIKGLRQAMVSSSSRGSGGGGNERNERSSKRLKKVREQGRAVRRTQFSKAVSRLENAVCRFVEEQASLLQYSASKEAEGEGGTAEAEDGGLLTQAATPHSPAGPSPAPVPPFAETAGVSVASTLQQVRVLLTDKLQTIIVNPGLSLDFSKSLNNYSGGGGSGGYSLPLSFTEFSDRITSSLLTKHTATSEGATAAATVALQPLVELFFSSFPPGGWTPFAVELLETVLASAETMKLQEMLKLASQIGGPLMFRHALHAILRRQAATAAAPGGAAAGGGSQQLFATQQSQLPSPLLSPSVLRGGGGGVGAGSQQMSQTAVERAEAAETAAAAEAARKAAVELNTLLKTLGDTISALALSSKGQVGRESQVTAAAAAAAAAASQREREFSDLSAATNSLEEEKEKEEQHRMNRLGHISASTLQFVYSLTHSALNNAAKKRAAERIPRHLSLHKRKIVEHAAFPAFPPLPLPSWCTDSTTNNPLAAVAVVNNYNSSLDIHDIVQTFPDSRHSTHSMVPGVQGPQQKHHLAKWHEQQKEEKRLKGLAEQLSDDGAAAAAAASGVDFRDIEHGEWQPRAGAFETWAAAGGVASQNQSQRGALASSGRAAATAAGVVSDVHAHGILGIQVPAEAQDVLSNAMKVGVHPDVVQRAASRILLEMGSGTSS